MKKLLFIFSAMLLIQAFVVSVFAQDKDQHEYVDLGLSVKWATCNIGADMPEEYGDYYAWGELEPKESFTWENYRFRTRGYDEGTVRLSKYTSFVYTGMYDENGISIADDKTLLELEDDVAHVMWGGNWRLPTDEEMNELIDSCTWIWTTLNGVKGCRVTSNRPGYADRSIFLPYYYGGTSGDVGYWFGSFNANSNDNDATACLWICFDGHIRSGYCYRHWQLPVRPVCE